MLNDLKEKILIKISRISMHLDKNLYARTKLLPLKYSLFKEKTLLINEDTGYDISYQLNKVHNLKLAAETLNHLLIRPEETFSFWYLVHNADRYEKYKEALVLKEGKIVPGYGGGLCQLSGLLFYVMLHSPLTIAERHGHKVLDFPSTDKSFPKGTDATVYEPYLDLKFVNHSKINFVIEINFDETYMYIEISSDKKIDQDFGITNRNLQYIEEKSKTIEYVDIYRGDEYLYTNRCQINYEMKE